MSLNPPPTIPTPAGQPSTAYPDYSPSNGLGTISSTENGGIGINEYGMIFFKNLQTGTYGQIVLNADGITKDSDPTVPWGTITTALENIVAVVPPPDATTLEVNNKIIITDGTNTNTINQYGYSTKNTSANLTHYLNFSDASTTGIGAIQKTAGLNVNPSTNTITATTFSGDLSGNVLIQDDNTNATFYPVFVSNNTGELPLKVDKTTNPLSYNPNTGNLTATTFSGTATTATTATNITTTSDNTAGTYYIPFSKTTAGTSTALYLDDTTTPLTYNPSTNTIIATIFSGTATTATNATNVGITTDNTSGTYYLPFVKTSGTGNKQLFIDDTTTPLSYNPSTANLSTSIFTGSANITNAVNTYTFVATTLTLDFSTLTFKNFYNSTAITTAITQSAIAFSNAVAGGSYMVYITTGVGGSFTFNTGITNVKTTFSTAFTIPASSVGVMSIYYINSVYIVGINILT